MPSAWINGQLTDEAEACVSIKDAGLLHAAGVFTTLRAYRGRVFMLDRHLARIRDSALALFIPLNYSDEALASAVNEVLKANELTDARLRLTLTRGITRRDPLHGMAMTPNAFLTATALEPYPPRLYEEGMTVILIDEQKLNPYDAQAGHKTLNYLSRLLALRAAGGQAAAEGLWFNVHNYLQSGCMSNVFVVKDERLLTPPTAKDLQDAAIAEKCPYPKAAVLPGIARSVTLDLAKAAGIDMEFGAIDVNRLLDADEVFLTNSVMQITPVCRIERRVIGSDRPGKITRKLMAAYDSLVLQL
jgi:branched-chain amino acid aminotransferase